MLFRSLSLLSFFLALVCFCLYGSLCFIRSFSNIRFHYFVVSFLLLVRCSSFCMHLFYIVLPFSRSSLLSSFLPSFLHYLPSFFLSCFLSFFLSFPFVLSLFLAFSQYFLLFLSNFVWFLSVMLSLFHFSCLPFFRSSALLYVFLSSFLLPFSSLVPLSSFFFLLPDSSLF